MNLSGILSIAGYPGLFKMVSQMKGGLVVESLLDGKRMPAYATQKILALEDISIYTIEDEVPLAEVFKLLVKKSGGKAALNPKKVSVKELGDYLEAVLPTYDKDRVYNSDIKKLFQWFNLLVDKGLLKEEEKKKEEKPKKKAEPKTKKTVTPTNKKPEPKGKKPVTKKVKK
ncbi:DUF5606 domain-containing protein [Bacteroidota bacterium]